MKILVLFLVFGFFLFPEGTFLYAQASFDVHCYLYTRSTLSPRTTEELQEQYNQMVYCIDKLEGKLSEMGSRLDTAERDIRLNQRLIDRLTTFIASPRQATKSASSAESVG